MFNLMFCDDFRDIFSTINLMAVSEQDSHLVQTAQVIILSTQDNKLCAHDEDLNKTINGTEH